MSVGGDHIPLQRNVAMKALKGEGKSKESDREEEEEEQLQWVVKSVAIKERYR